VAKGGQDIGHKGGLAPVLRYKRAPIGGGDCFLYIKPFSTRLTQTEDEVRLHDLLRIDFLN
jgi:hypothetical protein